MVRGIYIRMGDEVPNNILTARSGAVTSREIEGIRCKKTL